MTLAELNACSSKSEFVDAIGWVFEHSPWVAERAWPGNGHFASFDDLSTHLIQEVQSASPDEQLALLCAPIPISERESENERGSQPPSNPARVWISLNPKPSTMRCCG